MKTTIDFFGEVGHDLAVARFKEAVESAAVAGHDIELRICCTGGQAFPALDMHDLLIAARHAGSRVSCVVDGCCCSAGLAVLAACSWRTMNAGAVLHFHSPRSATGGDFADLAHKAALLDEYEVRLADAFGGIDRKAVAACRSWISSGKWFDAESALRVGVIDEIETGTPHRRIEANAMIASLADVPDELRSGLRAPVEAAIESIEAHCRLGRRALNRSTAEMCHRDAVAEAARMIDLPNVTNDDLRRATDAIDALKKSLACDQHYSLAN